MYKIIYSFYGCLCCIYICIPHVCIASGSQKMYQILRNCVVVSAIWVLGTKSWSSGRAATSRIHRVISATSIQHFIYSLCMYVACVCIHVHARIYAHASVKARRQLWVSFLRTIHLPFLRHVHSLVCSSPLSRLGDYPASPKNLPISTSPILGLQAHSHHIQLLLFFIVGFVLF